jgi:alcohol dehydrogenase
MQDQFVPNFSWYHPTRIVYGVGKLGELPAEVGNLVEPGSSVFLVTGRTSLETRGILQKVLDGLSDYEVTVFNDVRPFPSPANVDSAVEACKASNANIVVAIGGGSAMDLAKAVAILSVHDGSALAYATKEREFTHKGLPFIAAPTTSGSSSEVTSGAALWDLEGKKHYGLSGPNMFPDVAIVDPDLTMSMSTSLAANTGMDAFTSAFESYWNRDSNPISDAIDLDVIRAFATNLERSAIQGDMESRAACALAASMSGAAYSNSRPNACHAIGGPLTLYWGIEHGQAVGITLGGFLRHAAPAIAHKTNVLWDALRVADVDGAVQRITQIMSRCGLETTLSGLGLTEPDIDTIVDNTIWARIDPLPTPMDRGQLKEMLTSIF